MKKLVMLVILIISINISFAEEINIPETFTAETSVNEVTTYYYAGDKLLASENNNIVTYHYQDGLGSDVSSKTLPFGQEIVSSERFSFTGKELDSELYYFNARYYDSDLGRFTSVDPVQDNHPYAYVANNPMNYVDPDGREIHAYTWTVDGVSKTIDYTVEGGANVADYIKMMDEIRQFSPRFFGKSTNRYVFGAAISEYDKTLNVVHVSDPWDLIHEMMHSIATPDIERGLLTEFASYSWEEEFFKYMENVKGVVPQGRTPLSMAAAEGPQNFYEAFRKSSYMQSYPELTETFLKKDLARIIKIFSSESLGLVGDSYDITYGYTHPEILSQEWSSGQLFLEHYQSFGGMGAQLHQRAFASLSAWAVTMGEMTSRIVQEIGAAGGKQALGRESYIQ